MWRCGSRRTVKEDGERRREGGIMKHIYALAALPVLACGFVLAGSAQASGRSPTPRRTTPDVSWSFMSRARRSGSTTISLKPRKQVRVPSVGLHSPC